MFYGKVRVEGSNCSNTPLFFWITSVYSLRYNRSADWPRFTMFYPLCGWSPRSLIILPFRSKEIHKLSYSSYMQNAEQQKHDATVFCLLFYCCCCFQFGGSTFEMLVLTPKGDKNMIYILGRIHWGIHVFQKLGGSAPVYLCDRGIVDQFILCVFIPLIKLMMIFSFLTRISVFPTLLQARSCFGGATFEMWLWNG